MEKKKVTVFVAGQKLTLITAESEKYVTDIASKVDTAINSLFSATKMSREKCAVMTALDFCDDEAKAKESLNQLKEQIKDYIEDSAKLRAENEELKAEIEKLKGDSKNAPVIENSQPPVAQAVEEKAEVEITEKIETIQEKSEISSSDDLSFDFEEDIKKPEEKQVEDVAPAVVEEKKEATPNFSQNAPAKKNDKKRHNHSHVNPFKERFMKNQNENKGYTPIRQYTLFDKENN